MNALKIKWQRLVVDGRTCPRCGSTEEELDKAVYTLKQYLNPLGIEVLLEKEELTFAEFEKDPLKSNQIWLNERPLEDWIGGKSGQSPCCDVCGPSQCRTIEIGEKVLEAVPFDLIVKAGLLAALELIDKGANKSCCEKDASFCCSK